MPRTGYGQGAHPAAGTPEQRQWERLTEEDWERAAGRGPLARTIATRYEISVNKAKRQVLPAKRGRPFKVKPAEA